MVQVGAYQQAAGYYKNTVDRREKQQADRYVGRRKRRMPDMWIKVRNRRFPVRHRMF